jgi:glutathione S-transferase
MALRAGRRWYAAKPGRRHAGRRAAGALRGRRARPEALRWADWRDGQIDKVRTSLQALEQAPQQLQGRVDIGTLSLACALGYLDLRYDAWGWRGRFPAVAEWAEGFMQRPSMLAVWAA